MRCTTFAVTVAVMTGFAHADLVNPDIPSWRGDAGSSYAAFDTFSNAFGSPNFADAGGGGFQLFNFGAGAIVAGSGNLYNPSGELDIHLYSLAPVNTPTNAVLNISWGGTMLDTTDVRAFFGGQYYDATTVEQRSSVDAGGFGTIDTWAFTFDLSGAVGVDDIAFFFGNDGPHGSLDAVSVDVLGSPIPGPGVLATLVVAGAIGRRRRH